MASTVNGAQGSPDPLDGSGVKSSTPLVTATSDPSLAAVLGCAIVIYVWILSFRRYLSRTITSNGLNGRDNEQPGPDDPISWKETRIAFDFFRLLGSLLAAEAMSLFSSTNSSTSIFSLIAIDLVSSVFYFLFIRHEEFKKQLKHYTAFTFTTAGFSYGCTLHLLVISNHFNPSNVLVNTLTLLYMLVFCLFTWNAVEEVISKLELVPSERSSFTSAVYSVYGLTAVNAMYYMWPNSLPYFSFMEHFVPRTLSQVLIPLWLLLMCSLIITYRDIYSNLKKGDSTSAVLHLLPDATYSCGICCSGLILAWYCNGMRAPTDTIMYWTPLWPLLLADVLGIIGYYVVYFQYSSLREVGHATAKKASEDGIKLYTASVMKSVAVQASEDDGAAGPLTTLVTDKVLDKTSTPPIKTMGVPTVDEIGAGEAASIAQPTDVEVTGEAVAGAAKFLTRPLDVDETDDALDGTAVLSVKMVDVGGPGRSRKTPTRSMDVADPDEEKKGEGYEAIDKKEEEEEDLEATDEAKGGEEDADATVEEEKLKEEADTTDEEKKLEEDVETTDEEEEEDDTDESLDLLDDETINDSYKISVTTNAEQSVPVCSIILPPTAPGESMKITSAVLNPAEHLKLKETEVLVSDIIKMNSLTFSDPVRLTIPHSLPKYPGEWQFIVVASSDSGSTWKELETESLEESEQRFAIVETTNLGQFAVKAKPLKHIHRIETGKATTLKSSKETGVEVSIPSDCVSKDEEISFEVTPVGKATLSCAGKKDATVMADTDCMSHILKFSKGSGLCLKRPVTIVIPLTSPADGKAAARVMSCNDRGEWEDITDTVDDIALEHSKVAFKTDRLRDAFAALVSKKPSDPTESAKVMELVSKSVHANEVKTAVFKKWKEPREEGVMTVLIESIIDEYVKDRIGRRTIAEGYDLQGGTPTAAVTMVENETCCAYFKGNIHPPDCDSVNGLYRTSFTFHSAAPCKLKFDVKLDEKKESTDVGIYSGPKEKCPVLRPGELPASPLAKMEITTPTGITCEYWLACRMFKNTMGIEDHHFYPDGDMCYCYRCHNDRGDRDWYVRGDPPETYAIPRGWSRFGVRVNPAFMDKDMPVFNNWHRAFHGTDPVVVKKILQSSSQLLIPGDTMLGGHTLGEKGGHFTPDRKPSGFDTRQVFVSLSIQYAGHEAYAAPQRYKDTNGKEYEVRVALQLCVRPGSYTVGPETIGASLVGKTIDPLFSNDELEWFTKERGGHALYGLLIKMDPK